MVQSSLFVEDCFLKSSLSLMHSGVTFSRGLSLGSHALAPFFSFKENKYRTDEHCKQGAYLAACLGKQDIPVRTEAVKWYLSLSSGSGLPLKTEL